MIGDFLRRRPFPRPSRITEPPSFLIYREAVPVQGPIEPYQLLVRQKVQEFRGELARTIAVQRQVGVERVSQPRFDPMHRHIEIRTRGRRR